MDGQPIDRDALKRLLALLGSDPAELADLLDDYSEDAPDLALGEREIIILLFGAASGTALVLALKLVAVAGPVFASQMAYAQTLAGIAWGILLLGERLSALAWGSLILIILGFWLVEPRRAGDEFRATLRLRGGKQDRT